MPTVAMVSVPFPQIHTWTRDEYHRMADMGLFLNRRMLHQPPLVPPILGGDQSSKSPRIGGFRGLKRWQAVMGNLCVRSSALWEKGSQIGSPSPFGRGI